MSSLEHMNPIRYDFKVEYHDFGQTSVQKITTEFGQYVSFDAYWKLLCEFSEYEDSQQEEEE